MQAVIIAAGESSRFWPLSQNHKSLTYLFSKPLIYWTMKGLAENGAKDMVVVCKADSALPAMLKKENDLGVSLRFVFQEKSLGTGNALWQARELIHEPFFAVWPNKINAGELAGTLLKAKREQGLRAAFVGARTQTPWDYGIGKFDGDRLVEIVENPEQGKEPSQIKIIGFYLFEPDFFGYYAKLQKHHEADLIDAVNAYLKDKKAEVVQIEKDVPTLKYPWDLFSLLDILFRGIGFTPSISPSAIIGKNVYMSGPVFIGDNTVIKDNTIIEGPCFIGADCLIGHSNVLRGPLNIEKNVKTGAFFEIKHSIVQEGSHFHSGYLGDSIIGKNCKIAAGFISANRRLDRQEISVAVKGKETNTQFTYMGAIIGDNTSFGVQSGTMPGVLIGSNCVVGPGTQIFENIDDNMSAYAKPQHIVKRRNVA